MGWLSHPSPPAPKFAMAFPAHKCLEESFQKVSKQDVGLGLHITYFEDNSFISGSGIKCHTDFGWDRVNLT